MPPPPRSGVDHALIEGHSTRTGAVGGCPQGAAGGTAAAVHRGTDLDPYAATLVTCHLILIDHRSWPGRSSGARKRSGAGCCPGIICGVRPGSGSGRTSTPTRGSTATTRWPAARRCYACHPVRRSPARRRPTCTGSSTPPTSPTTCTSCCRPRSGPTPSRVSGCTTPRCRAPAAASWSPPPPQPRERAHTQARTHTQARGRPPTRSHPQARGRPQTRAHPQAQGRPPARSRAPARSRPSRRRPRRTAHRAHRAGPDRRIRPTPAGRPDHTARPPRQLQPPH